MHYRSIVRIAVLAVSFLSSNSATIAQEIQCSFEVNACDKPLVNNLAQRCTGAGVDVLSPETQQCCNSILLAQASLSGCARRDLLAAYTGHADGTTLIDISGNGNDGILSGAQVVERSAPADYALSFPGGESHVSIPGDFLRAQPLNELTISLEVKREGLDLESRFISLASGFQAEENYIMLGQGTGSASIRTRVVTNENTVHTLSTQQEIPDQEYAHVALVYTGAKIEVYIDGLLQSSLEQSGPILIPQNLDLFLGANPNSPVPFHGELDNILLYSRALAPSEIARMAGHEFFISPSTPYALTIQEGSSPSPENLRREYQIANLTGTQKQFGLTLDGTPGWLNIVGGYTSLSVPADSLRSFSAELINLEELPSGGHSSSILLTELQSLHQRKGKHALKKKIARILRSPKRLGMWLTRDCASLRSSRRVRRCTRIQSRLQRSQVVSSYDGTSSSPASEFGPSITLPVSVLVGSGNNNTQVAHCKDPGAIKPGPGNTGPYNASLLTTYTGSLTITEDTVLENVFISGQIEVLQGATLTLRNFIIDAGFAPYGVKVYDTASALLEYGEISNMNSAAVQGSNFTARWLNVHDSGGDGFKPVSNTIIEGCWVHHLGTADGAHADGIQMRQGGYSYFAGNNFDMPINELGGPGEPYKSNSAFIIQAAEDFIYDVVIEGNWINGGNFSVYLTTKTLPYELHNPVLTNNCFGTAYRYGTLSYGTLPVYNPIVTGNIWEDSGEVMDINQ